MREIKLYRMSEASEEIGVSRQSLSKWVSEGRIEVYVLGGERRYISGRDVEVFKRFKQKEDNKDGGIKL